MIKAAVTLLSIFLISSGAFAQVNSDVEIFYDVEYKINNAYENFRLSEIHKVKKIYHGDRSAESEFIITYGCKSVKAKINDEKLNRYYANKYYLVPRDDFKAGDVFEYELRYEHKDLNFFPLIYIQNEGYIHRYYIEIKHSADMDLEVDVFYPRDSLYPAIDQERKKTEITFRGLPYQKRIPLFPYNSLQAAILISLNKNGELYTPTTPEKFVEWYYDYAYLNRTFDSLLYAELDSLLADKSEDTVLLRNIHDFIRSNIRYITDLPDSKGIIPNDPDSFFVLKYGDCKDRALFVSKVADLAGLEVEMGLVHTSRVPDFNGKVHVGLFNHVVCAYPFEDSICYFDPTAKYTRFGNPLNYIAGKDILILDRENPRYEKLPPSNASPSLEISVSAAMDSLFKGTAQIIVRNELEHQILWAENNVPGDNFEEYFNDVIHSRMGNIVLRNFVKTGMYGDRTEYEAEADISELMIPSRDKVYTTRLPFNIGDKDLSVRYDDDYPLTLGNSYGLRFELNLLAPEYETECDSLFHYLNDNIYYVASIQPKDSGCIGLSYYYRRIPETLEGDLRSEFIDYGLELIQKKKDMFIIYRRNSETD